jgi:serine/threonine-protein kinase
VEDLPLTQRATSRSLPGDLIGGKYLVERVIGEGGVGVVLEAVDTESGARVAVKIANAAEGEAAAAFKRNARAMMGLGGRHVPRVLEVGITADGLPWVATEYLTGEDLEATVAERGPLSIEDAVRWMMQACEAIGEAHDVGLMHRGIKPRNLFLAAEGGSTGIRVLDFGMSIAPPLAATSGDDVAEPPTVSLANLHSAVTRFVPGATAARSERDPVTQPNGSPVESAEPSIHLLHAMQYMAPEQLRAGEVDARTDVWALGACLFRLLTGAFPFGGTTVSEITECVLGQPPIELRALRADASNALDGVIKQCLRRAPRNRYQSMEALAQALRAVRDEARETPVVIAAAEAAFADELPPATPIVTPPVAALAHARGDGNDGAPPTPLVPVRLAVAAAARTQPFTAGRAADALLKRLPEILMPKAKASEPAARRPAAEPHAPAQARAVRPEDAPATPLLLELAKPPLARPEPAFGKPESVRAPDTVQDVPAIAADPEVPRIFTGPPMDRGSHGRASPDIFGFASSAPPALSDNVHRAELDWRPNAAANAVTFTPDVATPPTPYATRRPSSRAASISFAVGLIALAVVSVGLLHASSFRWPTRLSPAAHGPSGTEAARPIGSPSPSPTSGSSAPTPSSSATATPPPAASDSGPAMASSAPSPPASSPSLSPPPPPPPASVPPPTAAPTPRKPRPTPPPGAAPADPEPTSRPSRPPSEGRGEPSILDKRK